MKPCCDKRTMVGMITMIDMTFGAILLGLCIHSLLFFSITDHFSQMSWTRLLLLFPIILNTFQILTSFHLLMSIKQIDPLNSLAKTTIWFNGAVITLICLILKFIILLFNFWSGPTTILTGNGDSSTNLLITLTISETMFKIVSLFLIQNFYLEELKLEAQHPPSLRHVQFYSVYIPPSSTITTPTIIPTHSC